MKTCDAFVAAYEHLIGLVSSQPIKSKEARQQMTISMKPSMFTTIAPQPTAASKAALEKAFERIAKVVEIALSMAFP